MIRKGAITERNIIAKEQINKKIKQKRLNSLT